MMHFLLIISAATDFFSFNSIGGFPMFFFFFLRTSFISLFLQAIGHTPIRLNNHKKSGDLKKGGKKKRKKKER